MNPILMIPLAFATALLAAGPTQAQQQQPTPLRESIAAYNRAVAEDKATVEQLFDLGQQAVRDFLDYVGAAPYGPDVEQERFDAMSRQMPGYEIGTNLMFSYAEPKVAFFRDLSRRRGRPQDIAFFAALTAEYQDGIQRWPVYQQQLTDENGCDRFDGSLVRIDTTWRRYRQYYPHSYVRHVAEKLDQEADILADMIEQKWVCGCNEQPEAERELTELSRLGPLDRVGKSAAELLRGLRDKSVDFKAHCRPS